MGLRKPPTKQQTIHFRQRFIMDGAEWNQLSPMQLECIEISRIVEAEGLITGDTDTHGLIITP